MCRGLGHAVQRYVVCMHVPCVSVLVVGVLAGEGCRTEGLRVCLAVAAWRVLCPSRPVGELGRASNRHAKLLQG